MNDPTIGVLLVEDDPIVRAWVRLSLEGSEFRISGEAETVAEALDLIRRRRSDLLLLDQRLPDGLGTDLLRSLRTSGLAAPAIVMTATTVAGFNETVREAGAQGSVRKSAHAGKLLRTLREVRAGGESFDPEHPQRSRGTVTLSARERETLTLVARGATNREIGEALEVSPETVKTLISRAFMKLGAHRRTQAVAEARKLGLIS